MSSEKIEFGLGNPLRVVVTSWTGDNSANRKNDKSFKLFKEYSSPFADAFFQQLISSDSCIVQIQSSFGSTNTCKVKNYFTDADVKTITLTEEADESAYKVYEADLALDTGLSNGKYYLLFNGTDSDGGTYEARSEPFELVSEADCNSLLITYYNNEPGFGIDYRTGVTNYIRIPGIFDQDSDTAEVDISTDSKGIRRNISDETQQARFLQLGNKNNPNGIPDWYAQKLNYALAHDYCDIEGIQVSSENRIPQEYGRGLYWNDGEAIIHFSDGLTRNLHDADERVLYLDAPTALTASPQSESQILLEWVDESENEDSFEVWRSLTTGTGFVKIAEVFGADEYTDSGLDADTTYYYKVRGKAEGSLSGFSSEASAKTFNAFISTWKTDNTGSSNNDQVTIPTISTGTYACIVDWGDGVREIIATWNDSKWTHTYDSSGTYEVKIYGTIEGFQFNNGGDRRKITAISKWGDLELGSQGGIFYGCTNLDLSSVIDVLDTSACTTFQDWFRSCSSLTTINRVDEWDTSLNESLRGTFQDSAINDSGLDSWDTSSVTTLLNCFDGASSFNQSLNSWDVSAVVNMQLCFANASSFNQSLNSWVTTACTNMNAVFLNASAFNGNITSWSANIVTNFGNMFNGSAFNQDIGGWNVGSGTNFRGMFANCPFNQDIDDWDMSSATDFVNMFLNNTAFDQDLNSWVVTSVTSIASMFRGSNFNSGIGSWTLSSLTEMTRAFEGNTAFNQDISGWDVSGVQDMSQAFQNATSFNQNISGWTTTALEDLNATFNGASVFNQDLSGWDVTNLTDAAAMFEDSNLSTVNYNALLVGWEGQAVQDNVVFSGGDAQHSGSGSTARAALIADHTWTITDGGAA